MTWNNARIIRDSYNDCYILAFFDDSKCNVVCGGRFSTKRDAETALHIAVIIENQSLETDSRITRNLQAFCDNANIDVDEELDLWF